MPQSWSEHDERMYEAIRDGCMADGAKFDGEDIGGCGGRARKQNKSGCQKACERLAAATVNKRRSQGLGSVKLSSGTPAPGFDGSGGKPTPSPALGDVPFKLPGDEAEEGSALKRRLEVRRGKPRRMSIRELERDVDLMLLMPCSDGRTVLANRLKDDLERKYNKTKARKNRLRLEDALEIVSMARNECARFRGGDR